MTYTSLSHARNASGRVIVAAASGVLAALTLALCAPATLAAPDRAVDSNGHPLILKVSGGMRWEPTQLTITRVEGAGKPQGPSQWGEWIADVERPAAQYRGRYQLRLSDARYPSPELSG
jgi:hypothetical protein